MYIYILTFFEATFPGVTYHLIPTLRSKNQLTHFSWKTTLPLSLLLLAHYENMLKGVVESERETISSGWFIICMYAKTTPCVY